MSLLKHKAIMRLGKIIVPLLILMIIGYETKEIFTDFNWKLLSIYWEKLSYQKIIIILIIGLISLVPMYFYDVILLYIFHISIPKRKLFLYSLSANTFSNLVGFGGVAGATLRTYYYRPYVTENTPFIRNIAKLSLFFLTGLSLLAWTIVFSDFHVYAEVKFIRFAVWAIALYMPLLLLLLTFQKSFWNFRQQKHYIIELITVSFFEWIFVVLCIWGIAYLLDVKVSILVIFPIVIISACSGIISMLPGGIGTFDLVFLIGMETHGIQAEIGLLIIMLYRLSYYIFPTLLAAPFVLHEVMGNRNRLKS